MSELRKGDIVQLNTDINMNFPKGISMTVFYANDDYIELVTSFKAKSYNVKKIGESKMKYKESNRYKLHEAIKKTGITSKDLSLAQTKGESIYYFSNFTKKSRFEDRGDISLELLSSLKTDLAFAEREVLGIGAKEFGVDTAQKNSVASSVYAIKEMNKTMRKFMARDENYSGVYTGNEQMKKHDDLAYSLSHSVYSLNEHLGAKQKSKSNKRPLVLFLIMVILASFYFLNLFFGWV